MPLLDDSDSQVSPIHRESSLRTLRNAHFRREEVPHDEGQLVATYPKKFSQVSPIDRHLQQIEGILAVKFIMGRDLAVTRSSPDSC